MQKDFRNFYIFDINKSQTLISQIVRVLVALGEKLSIFDPLGFKAKCDFDCKTSKIKS